MFKGLFSEEQDKKMKGMKYGGVFHNKSFWGYNATVLKSGICKYFRREMFDKFEWCVNEMLLLGLMNKSLMTNLLNRLSVILMEELVCTEKNIIYNGILILNKIEESCNYLEKIYLVKAFCKLIIIAKRGRLTSYMNSWWGNRSDREIEEFENEIAEVDIINMRNLGLIKKGDCERLIKLGELMINYLDNEDRSVKEKIFYLYFEMEKMMENVGIRYRRKNAEYLFIKILENKYCVNDVNRVIFNFMLKNYNKKKVEKKAFAIWLGMLYLFEDKSSEVENESIDFKKFIMNEVECFNYLIGEREYLLINEDFVVNDYHVNKKFGLKKFGLVGSVVINEDLSLLGENGEKYLKYYRSVKEKLEESSKKVESKVQSKVKVEKMKIVKKNWKIVKKDGKIVKKDGKIVLRKVKSKKVSESKSKSKNKNDEEFNLFVVNEFYDKYNVVKILDDGVCCMKKPCILVEDKEDGKKYVLKAMSKNLNFGKDYAFIDEIRGKLGLLQSHIFRIKTNIKMELKDKSIRNYNKNCNIVKSVKCDNVYCVMDYFENIGDLGKNKNLLDNEVIKSNLLKIRISLGLFRVSDNIIRNILINDKGDLLSIDENDIFGKRKLIFNKNDWCKKDVWCIDNYENIVNEIKSLISKEECIEVLKKYNFNNENVLINEFIERYDNLLDIVKSEY